MARRSSRRRHIQFHVTVVAGVLMIVSVMTVSTVGMILSVARKTARETAARQFELSGGTIHEKTVSLLQPAMDLALTASAIPSIGAQISATGLDHPARFIFGNILRSKPVFYSAYIGYADGTFIQVIHAADNSLILDAHDAPADTDLIIRAISVDGERRTQHWAFVDPDDTVLGERLEDTVDYDPRARPWYEDTIADAGATLTRPYVFNSLKQPGITAAHRLPEGRGVVGVDFTISSLITFITDQQVSEHGGSAILTGDLETIAASPGIEPLIKDYIEMDPVPAGNEELLLIGDRLVGVEFRDIAPNQRTAILTAAPITDFMASAMELQRKILLLSVLILVVTIPFVVLWVRRLSRTLKELSADAARVSRFDFGGSLRVHTSVLEFQQLAAAFGVMKSTISERTRELEMTLGKLEMLVEMSIAMSAEFDINRLSEMILENAKRLTHADGGSLYLVDPEKTRLEFQIVLNDSLGFQRGGTSGTPVGMNPVPLYTPEGAENHNNVVSHAFHISRTENIADAYETGTYDFSGTRTFDEQNGYRSVSFLTVPLKQRGRGDVLGALQLLNATDPETGKIVPFPKEVESFVEALSSAAAVALQNWCLMERQKRLFDDLVRFVGITIDAKSPYTARHCERVPEIAKILAAKAEETQSGRFAEFSFASAEQQREFEVSAWLHDCGKVTTPEYVVDKATKLETIYNRIHEIRTRFEVLLRDARIERHESVLSGSNAEEADRVLADRTRSLYDDFAFVAECNIGSEYMRDEDLDRLSRIASKEWLRYFDNRLGLSWAERRMLENRHGTFGSKEAPVPEKLIENKPEQIIPRENWTQESYDGYGFRFSVPEHLYNRGELYNLSIRAGTLTAEERFKIDEHVAQTIVMLEQLPFSDDLKLVPEYAGTHHETPDGTGYPRGLDGATLSIPARIMAIADIFEALTSRDRPYKRDKTLSEAIEILYQMKQQGRIDPDLFDLLISSGAYREYAERYLDVSQIDAVDEVKYLGQT